MASAVPASCAVALKEWATVLEAMSRGEQLVLIRKGGLIEPGQGFTLAAETFVFYPTFEHQAVNYLRPNYRGYFDEALRQRAPEGQVRIELVGAAVASAQSRDPDIVERLSSFHIYNREFVTQRLKWQPEQPLTLVVVRAFRLPAPHLLRVAPHYAGCTSWVELASPVPVEEARPVVEEVVFQRRAGELQAFLTGGVSGPR